MATKVKVYFEGIIINEINGSSGYRISVKKPSINGKAWWAVVPKEAVEIMEDEDGES